jgi:hypothetical protein
MFLKFFTVDDIVQWMKNDYYRKNWGDTVIVPPLKFFESINYLKPNRVYNKELGPEWDWSLLDNKERRTTIALMRDHLHHNSWALLMLFGVPWNRFWMNIWATDDADGLILVVRQDPDVDHMKVDSIDIPVHPIVGNRNVYNCLKQDGYFPIRNTEWCVVPREIMLPEQHRKNTEKRTEKRYVNYHDPFCYRTSKTLEKQITTIFI